MSAYGTKRTRRWRCRMSTFEGKANTYTIGCDHCPDRDGITGEAVVAAALGPAPTTALPAWASARGRQWPAAEAPGS
jgi:hypothetical protein